MFITGLGAYSASSHYTSVDLLSILNSQWKKNIDGILIKLRKFYFRQTDQAICARIVCVCGLYPNSFVAHFVYYMVIDFEITIIGLWVNVLLETRRNVFHHFDIDLTLAYNFAFKKLWKHQGKGSVSRKLHNVACAQWFINAQCVYKIIACY